MEIVITLPLAGSQLHAHNKGHWRTKAPYIKARRRLAAAEAAIAMAEQNYTPSKRSQIEYRFYVPNNGVRDTVNMMQSEKATIDGFSDAGLIKNDRWQYLTIAGVFVEVDKDNPRVEFVIRGRQ